MGFRSFVLLLLVLCAADRAVAFPTCSQLLDAASFASSKDLWPRRYSRGLLYAAKLAFYPFVATAKLATLGAMAVRGKAPVVDEATRSFRHDLVPFLAHFLLYSMSQLSLATYSSVAEVAGPPPKDGPVVVIEGFKQGHPLRSAVKAHFERSYSHNPRAVFVDLRKQKLTLNGALLEAYAVSKKFGPLKRLEIHSDMCPGSIHINSDSLNKAGVRALSSMLGYALLNRTVDLETLSNADFVVQKGEIARQIQASLMADDSEIIAYGCSVFAGEQGEALGKEMVRSLTRGDGRVVGSSVDLYRDYPDYVMEDLFQTTAPQEVRSQLNRAARYYMASLYLVSHFYKAGERGVLDFCYGDESLEATFAWPAVREFTALD